MVKLKIHISVSNHTGKEKSMNTKTYFYLNSILTNFTLIFTTYLREIVIQKVNILMKTKLNIKLSLSSPSLKGFKAQFLGEFFSGISHMVLSLLGKHSTEGNLVSHKLHAWSCIAQKMKFSIKDFFSKCDQIRSFPRIWSHLPKKSFIENFIFSAVIYNITMTKMRPYEQFRGKTFWNFRNRPTVLLTCLRDR